MKLTMSRSGLMHQQSATDCGWAGPAFIEKILAMDERQIVEAYEEAVFPVSLVNPRQVPTALVPK